MRTNTLVTVNILSYNRRDELRNTLLKVFEQDYKNIEVIVVDNASIDGSAEMVNAEFPTVKLIRLSKNIGIAGWNEGFKIARGDFVLVLDDDSYPNNNIISQSLNEFSGNSNVGVVAFNIWNISKKMNEISYNPANEMPHFVGCGALIRKTVFESVGYFNELLFLYEHERDFTLRLYEKDYIIKYKNNLVVNHNASYLNRSNKRMKYYFTRNYLIILFIYFSFNKVFLRMIRLIIGRCYSGIKQGGFFSILKGIVSFIILVPELMNLRVPLEESVQKKFGYGSFAGGFHFKEFDWYN